MKPNKRTYGLFIVAMLAMASIDNVRGVFVPSFKATYALSNANIGELFLMSSLIYMISSYFSGHAVSRWHHQIVLRFGAMITGLGVVVIAFSSSTLLFYAGMLALNVGIAAIALCVNTTVPLLDVKHKAVLMNGIHFLYGIGATLTQKSTGMLLGIGISFKSIYLGLGVLFVGLALITPWLPMVEKREDKREKRAYTASEKRILAIFSIALGLYVAAELQTANWLVNYLKTSYALNEAKAANVTAVFFLVFSLGRLGGGFVVQKIGYLKAIFMSLSIACVLYFAGLALGLTGAWLIAFSGVFFAVAYPTAMLAIADFFKNGVAQAASIIITASSGVNMLMGLLIGYIADWLNIKVAMYALPSALVVSVILFNWLYQQSKLQIEKAPSIST